MLFSLRIPFRKVDPQMFVPITNTPRNYDWGSLTAIGELLGHATSGRPEAELWLGAHRGSPSRIQQPHLTKGSQTLDHWIAADPDAALGSGSLGRGLPFLLKILAADAPLSLQAHPNREQAIAGFARENAAGTPLDAPERNYKDDQQKPEVIYALSETFEALCGFRPVEQSLESLGNLESRTARSALEPLTTRLRVSLKSAVEWILKAPSEQLMPGIQAVVDAAHAERTRDGVPDAQMSVARMLAEHYPNDPGILLSLLLNHVTLKRGEALYLPAGNIHAYLRGLGVELMAASDNVLRGGLTSKHIDVSELMAVLNFDESPIPYLRPKLRENGLEFFEPDLPDFRLIRVSNGTDAVVELTGPAIAACLSGETRLQGHKSGAVLTRGDFVYVTPDEGHLTVSAGAEVFLATTGRS